MVADLQAARLVALVALLLFGTCASADPPKDERLLLIELDIKFDRETAKLGVDGWVKYFAKNGSMQTGDNPPITGHEAIRKTMAPIFKQPGYSLRWTPKDAKILVSGHLGYTSGRFETKIRDPQGKVQTKTGTYLSVWKKQKDGSWKIHFDTGIPDGPKQK